MEKENENYTGKSAPHYMTWFVDIDGTILKHQSNHDLDYLEDCVKNGNIKTLEQYTIVLDGVLKWQESLPKCDRVILATARLERHREVTETQLEIAGLIYDHIVFNCATGPRVLVNDIKPAGAEDSNTNEEMKTAFAFNLKRDEGFLEINNSHLISNE
ncbi:MAG: hypothetical protein ISP71_08345 [Flavobacteriales bacterium]|nr:hypothetical protein [Flavobacteriales bacterium]